MYTLICCICIVAVGLGINIWVYYQTMKEYNDLIKELAKLEKKNKEKAIKG